MFTSPDRVHPTFVGHFSEFNELIIKLFLVLIRRDALHMNE